MSERTRLEGLATAYVYLERAYRDEPLQEYQDAMQDIQDEALKSVSLPDFWSAVETARKER